MNYVKEVAGDDVYIIWGTVKEDDVDNDKIIVTLIATGMEKKQATNPLTAKTLMGDFRINESKRPIEEQEIGIAVPPFLRDSISRHERKKSR